MFQCLASLAEDHVKCILRQGGHKSSFSHHFLPSFLFVSTKSLKMELKRRSKMSQKIAEKWLLLQNNPSVCVAH